MAASKAQIVEGMKRNQALLAGARPVEAKKADALTFVKDFKKLTNKWLIFVTKLEALKAGEAMALDTEKPPQALINAASTAEVCLEYALSDGKLFVRIAPAAIDEDLA